MYQVTPAWCVGQGRLTLCMVDSDRHSIPQNFVSNATEAQLNGTLVNADGSITKTGQVRMFFSASQLADAV